MPRYVELIQVSVADALLGETAGRLLAVPVLLFGVLILNGSPDSTNDRNLAMCQLTLEVDEQVLAQAEAVAQTENTTVTTLLQHFVESLAARSSDRAELAGRRLQATFAKLSRDMGDRQWTRESLYER